MLITESVSTSLSIDVIGGDQERVFCTFLDKNYVVIIIGGQAVATSPPSRVGAVPPVNELLDREVLIELLKNRANPSDPHTTFFVEFSFGFAAASVADNVPEYRVLTIDGLVPAEADALIGSLPVQVASNEVGKKSLVQRVHVLLFGSARGVESFAERQVSH